MSFDAKRLDRKDINRIINSLRTLYGPNIFGDCSNLFNPGVNEARLIPISLLKNKESASITDILFSAAELNSKTPFKTAMKIWFNWDTLSGMDISADFRKACSEDGKKICNSEQKRAILKKMNLTPATRIDSAGILHPTDDDILDSYLAMIETSGKKDNFTSLDYEARVYSFITENIIMRNLSPNFIPLFSTNECNIPTMVSALVATADFDGKDILVEKLKFLQDMSNNKLKMKFIMSGAVLIDKGERSGKMQDFIANSGRDLSRYDVACILFQLLYALYIFDAYKIMHNDLHLGNVFVQVLDKDQSMSFTIKGKTVTMSTRYIVKMYDYDSAQADALGINPKNEAIYFAGRTNSFRKNVDYSQLLCGLTGFESTIPSIKNILTALGIYDVSKKLATNSKKYGERIEHRRPSLAFKIFLRTLVPFAENNEDGKFYRISVDDLRSKFPVEYSFWSTKMYYEADITKNVVFTVNQRGDIFIFNRWMCVGVNDYIIDDITAIFETDKFETLAREFQGADPFTPGTLRYEFQEPSDLFIPPTNIADIYKTLYATHQARRTQKRGMESEILGEPEPAPVQKRSWLPKYRGFFGRGRAVLGEPEPAPVQKRSLFSGLFGRGRMEDSGWSPY